MSGSDKAEAPRDRADRVTAKGRPRDKASRTSRSGNAEVGRALRSVYDDMLRENIPDDFLELLGKLG